MSSKSTSADRPSKEQVLDRLPEIQLIERDDLREQVIAAFTDHAPGYFWTVRAAKSWHPADERGRHGLWLHTKRAFAAYEGMAPSFREQGLIDSEELDMGRAAILLHDMFKNGIGEDRSQYTLDDHDVLAYRYLFKNLDLPEPVLNCVKTHNGPWNAGPEPGTPLEQLHHLADMAASRPHANFAVLGPVPDELEQVSDVLQEVESFD